MQFHLLLVVRIVLLWNYLIVSSWYAFIVILVSVKCVCTYVPGLVEVMNDPTKWGLSDKNWYPLSVPPTK